MLPRKEKNYKCMTRSEDIYIYISGLSSMPNEYQLIIPSSEGMTSHSHSIIHKCEVMIFTELLYCHHEDKTKTCTALESNQIKK